MRNVDEEVFVKNVKQWNDPEYDASDIVVEEETSETTDDQTVENEDAEDVSSDEKENLLDKDDYYERVDRG